MTDDYRYCSWCFALSKHLLVQRNFVRRHVYECKACGSVTLKCRYCGNMARGKDNSETPPVEGGRSRRLLNYLKRRYDCELCAEHNGSIASFERLTEQLQELEEYEHLFQRDKANLLKFGKIAACVCGSALVFVPVAYYAAPALAAALGAQGLLGGASTGTAIKTLSGAALSNASPAAIGGGTALHGTIF